MWSSSSFIIKMMRMQHGDMWTCFCQDYSTTWNCWSRNVYQAWNCGIWNRWVEFKLRPRLLSSVEKSLYLSLFLPAGLTGILVLNWSQFRVNSKEWWEQLENTPLSFPRCHSNLEIIKKRNVWEPWLVFLKWQCSLKDIVCFPKTYLLQKMPMSFTKVRWDQKWSHISSGAIHSLLSNLDRVQNC